MTKRVLIVDDNEDNRQILIDLLSLRTVTRCWRR